MKKLHQHYFKEGKNIMDTQLKTNQDALTLALVLAITAPKNSKSQECISYAEVIAKDMTAKQVELCKAAAECAVEYQKQNPN